MNELAGTDRFSPRGETLRRGERPSHDRQNRRTSVATKAWLVPVVTLLVAMAALAVQAASEFLASEPHHCIQVAKLTASDGAEGDNFGWSASLSGDTVAVGARHDDDQGDSSGAVYVFDRDQGGADNWGQVTKITPSDGAQEDYFGDPVALDGDLLIVGASYDDDKGENSGSAYLFGRDQGGQDNWGHVAKLLAPKGQRAMPLASGCPSTATRPW